MDVFADAHSTIFGTLSAVGGSGEATYYAHDDLTRSSPVQVTAILSHNLTQWGDAVDISSGQTLVSIQRADVAAMPQRGALIEMDGGAVLEVQRTLSSDEYVHQCLCLGVCP